MGKMQFPVLLGGGGLELSAVSREELLSRLAKRRYLGTARHHVCTSAAAVRLKRLRRASLPVTERLTDNTLILPLFHQMSESEQARVIDVLRPAAN